MTQAGPPNSAPSGSILLSVARVIDNVLDATAIAVALTSLVVLFASMIAEVIVRYLTNQGLGWPTELPNILFPWLVMSGIVLAAQRGQHVSVKALLGLLGNGGARILLIALQVLATVTFLGLAWMGLDVLEITSAESYPVTGISAKWAYLALVTGFVAVGVTSITTILRLVGTPDPATVRLQPLEENA